MKKAFGDMTGDELARIRKAFKMTQADFAESIGVSQRTICTCENGQRIALVTQKAVESFCYQELYIEPKKAIEAVLIKLGAK